MMGYETSPVLRCSPFVLMGLFAVSLTFSPGLNAQEDQTCSMVTAAETHSAAQGEVIDDVVGRVETSDPLENITMLMERCLTANDHVPTIPIPSLGSLISGLKSRISQFACDVAGDIADRARDEIGGALNQTVGPLQISSSFGEGVGFSLDASGADIHEHIQKQAAVLREKAVKYQREISDAANRIPGS